MPRVLVAVDRRIGCLVDAHEPGILRIAARDRMVFELTEVAGERHVFGARDVLVAEEQHAVLQQQRTDLGHQRGVARGDTQVHIRKLGPERTAQRFDLDRGL